MVPALLIFLVLLCSSPAEAAPVVGAAAAVWGFFTAGGVGSIIGSLLLSAAFSMAASALTRQSYRGTAPTTPERRLSTRQATPPRRYVFGEVLVGGALFFEECKPPWLYMGFLLSEGPVESIQEIRVSDKRVNVNFDTLEALSEPYSGNLYVSFRNGDKDQLRDPLFSADWSSETTPDFRQRGVATLVIKANYGDNADQFVQLWGQTQKPNILGSIRGCLVYDPRDPTQVLPDDPEDWDQVYAAMETWRWSNNATLIEAQYMWMADGGKFPIGDIRWDKVAEFADYDDTLISTLQYSNLTSEDPSGTSTSTDGNTWLDRDQRLMNGAIVRSFGTSSSTAYTGSMMIVQRVSAGTYDVLHSQSISHSGNGWQDFKVDNFSIPDAGDFFVAVWTPDGITNNTIPSGVNRAFAVGEATGEGVTFTENNGQGLPVRSRLAFVGGLIPRYTIDGVVATDEEPFQVLESMRRSNRAIICRANGKVWPQSAKPQSSVLTITDSMIVGALSFRRAQPRQDLIRRLRVRFIDPRKQWSLVDGPIRTHPDWDGRYEATIDLPFTANPSRAQRIQKLTMLEAELGKRVVTLVSMEALGCTQDAELIAGKCVRIQSDFISRANGLYLVQEVEYVDDSKAFQLTLSEYDPTIEGQWDPAIDEQDFDLPEELN